jgi:hypothetical protein
VLNIFRDRSINTELKFSKLDTVLSSLLSFDFDSPLEVGILTTCPNTVFKILTNLMSESFSTF